MPPMMVAGVPVTPRAIRPLSTAAGIMINSPTDKNTARITATPMTILSMPLPSFSASHFSNLVGSSSMMPSISVDSCRVDMPEASIMPMLMTPRMMGQPIQGCFLARGVYSLRLTTMVPSGRRTEMAMASGAFIMTPSMTA